MYSLNVCFLGRKKYIFNPIWKYDITLDSQMGENLSEPTLFVCGRVSINYFCIKYIDRGKHASLNEGKRPF